MSMFRSAAEISSDSSDESDHEVVAAAPTASGSKPRTIGKGTKSPSLLAGENVEHYSGHATPKDPRDVEPEGHANLMTAALLEFYCMSRAADLLNAQPGSQMRFTRDSPEVQYLGKKMYAYKSQFLSSHGVLPDGVENDEWGTTRQYYRDNLDVLGVSALEDLNLRETPDRAPIGATGEIVLAPKGAKKTHMRSTNDHAGPSRPQLRRPKLADIGKRLTSAERIGPLEDIRLDLRRLPTQTFPKLSSSPVSFSLFESPPPSLRLSRYAMEFSEVHMLGRGSFGEVYHVKNHIDGQSYAVKKIPLSQRRLEQLQGGGENQLEGIMKEIRTLARLEHTNVVRYYGAWVEQAHVSGYMPPPQDDDSFEEEPDKEENDLLSHEASDSQSFGIVFEDSESTDFAQIKSSVEPDSMMSDRSRRRSSHATVTSRSSKKSSCRSAGEEDNEVESIPRDMHAFSHGPMSTFGATDDIFTDGYSHDPSRLQIQRRANQPQIPAVVLHIQMSLHPISLSSYLNPQAAKIDSDRKNSIPRRHCFHLVASLKLMLSILSGVDYLHSKGIVHRDLKPANIFLSTPDNRDLDGCASCQSSESAMPRYCHPRIGDFGLVADISHFNDNSSVDHDSKIHRIVGTEFYRPPLITNDIGDLDGIPELDEEHACYKIDESLDIYALGVILFELLYRLNTKMERQMVLNDLTRGPHEQPQSSPFTRRPSFPGDFARKIDMGDTMLGDGMSVAESLTRCITGMLEPLPSRRWHSSDVANCLQRILASAQEQATS
ncbi:kinase-like domain-containing protein [Aspergillus ambiguus]|uniref:putative protein kinase n=1 Tax=Aspergillus ambiguus TaxID=176160 RepID=UPI003CCDF560